MESLEEVLSNLRNGLGETVSPFMQVTADNFEMTSFLPPSEKA